MSSHPADLCNIGYHGIVCGQCNTAQGYVLHNKQCKYCISFSGKTVADVSSRSALVGLVGLVVGAVCMFGVSVWFMRQPAFNKKDHETLRLKISEDMINGSIEAEFAARGQVNREGLQVTNMYTIMIWVSSKYVFIKMC